MLYAAYGSNLHLLRLRQRTPSATFVGSAFLAAYSLRFHKRGKDRSAKCNIVTGTGGVHVAVYRVSRNDMAILDRIEGVGQGYDANTVTVPEFGECLTYTADSAYVEDSLRPYDWYREIVLAGCRALGFPGDYCDEIAAIDSARDPDEDRHREHWRLIETLRNGQ